LGLIKEILGLIIELLWTLPVAGLMILMQKKFAQLKNSAWAGPIGALVGALYAVALAFLVGPSIQAVDVPFLPLTMTVGAAVGAATLFREARPTFRRWSVAVCLLVILVTWTGFYAANASFARRESFRLIIIKLTSDPEPLHWVENGDSIPLNNTEKHAIEEAIGSVRPGALIPLSSLKIGKDARATVVLVMVRDVSDSVRLPRPGRGLVTFVQGQDGSWQGRHANAKGYAIRVLPNQENGYTRIEIEGPSGTTSAEVGVSHR
jgi:hypothetical protein